MSHWQPLDWMFLGYSAMWGAIVLYVGNLQRRQALLQRQLAALQEALERELGVPQEAAVSSPRADPAGVPAVDAAAASQRQ